MAGKRVMKVAVVHKAPVLGDFLNWIWCGQQLIACAVQAETQNEIAEIQPHDLTKRVMRHMAGFCRFIR